MKLELFLKETCPFCCKVMSEIYASGRTDVKTFDVDTDPANYNRLVNEGGKYQVPCLFIDGKPMYESDDIVTWLRQNPQG
jgi:glutaredoxin